MNAVRLFLTRWWISDKRTSFSATAFFSSCSLCPRFSRFFLGSSCVAVSFSLSALM